MSKKWLDDIAKMLEDEGFKVLGTKGGKSTSHFRFRCEYKGYSFMYAASYNLANSDPRWRANTIAIIRRMRRAIDTNDPVLLKKYLGIRK